MASSKNAASAAPVYDFDSWDEEAEEQALVSAVPEVKYIIVERRFVGRFENGDIVEVPLALSLETADALENSEKSAVDQFKTILTDVAGEEVAAVFARQNLIEAAIMAEKFFRVLQKVQRAAFPES